MANITRYIQRVVSGPKQRFKDPETDTDLDLSYISDNIIIMGYPTPASEKMVYNVYNISTTF